MRKTKLETRNAKLGVDGPRLGSLPLFAFRVSVFVFSRCWQFVRAVSGDNAYELYIERHGKKGVCDSLLSPQEFYRRQVERKYNGATPSRCC